MGSFADFLGSLHALDLLLMAVVLGLALVGFSKGSVKLLLVFAAILAGFIMASIFYVPFTLLVAPVFGLHPGDALHRSDTIVANAISFALLNVGLAVLVGFLLFNFFGHLEVTGRAGAMFDRPLGMMLGFVAGVVIADIIVTLLTVPYELISGLRLPRQEGAAGQIMYDWYTTSWFGEALRFQVMPYLVGMLRPLLPGGLPAILTGV